MKKNLFLMAAAAIALAACTNEDLSINDEKQVAQEPVGVVFDTYVSNGTSAVTRAAYAKHGAYSTENMKDANEGFGVFASFYGGNKKYTELGTGGTPFAPATFPASNFMYNQNVTFNSTNSAWSYTPLMYWPNQTSINENAEGITDSQTGNTAQADVLDRVSFFAYAPYQQTVDNKTSGLDKTDGKVYTATANTQKTVGVTEMISNTATKTPEIHYVMAKEPKESEDLLWAVAPYGGLNYTAVNGTPVKIDYGTSFVDLIKPAANTKIKFLFQHALSALKMSIVAAIDQVAPGGNLATETKIYVNSVKLISETAETGFAIEGTLSLLNRIENDAFVPNLPNWTVTAANTQDLYIGDTSAPTSSVPPFMAQSTPNITINPLLQSAKDGTSGLYTSTTNAGVTGDEVGLFANGSAGADKGDMLMFIPVLPTGYTYAGANALAVNLEIDYDVVTTSDNVDGGQVKVNNVIRKRITLPKYRNGRIYKLKLILGVSSVQFEAEAADWTTDEQDVDLPRNLD